MTKKLAKELLQTQIDKLGPPTNQTNEIWISKTASLIKDFFGETSEEYKFISKFKFKYDIIKTKEYNYWGATNTREAIQFLTDCIDTLDHRSLYKEPKSNFLMRLDNPTLVTIIIAALGLIGSVCYTWGKYNSDVQNIEFKQQLKAQQDTIKTLKIRLQPSSRLGKDTRKLER